MKPDFRTGQGHRVSKGDKIPSMDMLRRKTRHKATTQRTIHKQTICEKNSTNPIFDAVVKQMKSVEGITYYTARRTEKRWMESQYCYANVEYGERFRVSKTSDGNIWWFDDSSGSSNSNKPEF